MSNDGTSDSPLTSANFTKPAFRRGKHCKCQLCGAQAVCTPHSDFFVRSCDVKLEELNGPLYCISCVKRMHDAELKQETARKSTV